MHTWGTLVHLCTKYEALCSTLWLGEVCTDANGDANNDNDA